MKHGLTIKTAIAIGVSVLLSTVSAMKPTTATASDSDCGTTYDMNDGSGWGHSSATWGFTPVYTFNHQTNPHGTWIDERGMYHVSGGNAVHLGCIHE